MKHTIKVTSVILIIFLLAQFIGLAIVYNYVDFAQSEVEGKTVFMDTPLGERPPVDENVSFIPIMIAILIGTGLMLLLIKFKISWMWKFWFIIAVVMALGVAFSAFLIPEIGFFFALIFGIWKIFKPNFWIHNLTELFIYGGLAAIFVPLLNLISVSILLFLIAIYDAYAVWKSKHMITLAKSQTDAKVFAGLLIPYTVGKVKGKLKKIKTKLKMRKVKKTIKVRTAILGGGDIGFPLIFAGVVMKEMGLWQSLIIPFFSFAGLAFLFWRSEEKKFYPAMPFIGVGCFIGLGVVYLIGLLI